VRKFFNVYLEIKIEIIMFVKMHMKCRVEGKGA